jgi:hypothetical protein
VKKAPLFTFSLTREGIEARLVEMERKMDRLRSLYESFFMGMERIPPDTQRRELNRMMLEMQQVPIGNAAMRFRFQALTQKWVLQTTYWNRTIREIEAGTYRRDVARTQRHLAERGGVITEEEALALGIPKSRVKAFVARHQRGGARQAGTATPPAPAATTAPKSSSPASSPRSAAQGAGSAPLSRGTAPAPSLPALPGLSDQDFEGAYQRYLAAHRKLGITEQAMPKEKMHSRLGKQLPKILDEKKCDRVRLEIAVEDGKVRLRAWPSES